MNGVENLLLQMQKEGWSQVDMKLARAILEDLKEATRRSERRRRRRRWLRRPWAFVVKVLAGGLV